MAVNCDKPQRWKRDIALSVDLYNAWFLEFAPNTYREERVRATGNVQAMLERTGYLRKLTFRELSEHPSILFGLRMCTAPPNCERSPGRIGWCPKGPCRYHGEG
jgi:hypothetical protein